MAHSWQCSSISIILLSVASRRACRAIFVHMNGSGATWLLSSRTCEWCVSAMHNRHMKVVNPVKECEMHWLGPGGSGGHPGDESQVQTAGISEVVWSRHLHLHANPWFGRRVVFQNVSKSTGLGWASHQSSKWGHGDEGFCALLEGPYLFQSLCAWLGASFHLHQQSAKVVIVTS